jgi:integrase
MPPKRMTAADYFDEWLRVEAQKKSPKTYQGYESIIRVHLKPVFGEMQLTNLQNPFLIERAYATIQTKGRRDEKGGQLSAVTIRNIHRCLSKALADAVRWKLLKTNPCDGVVLPEIESDEVAVWKDADALQAIDCAENTVLPLPIAIGYYGGLRRGEILGLKESDVEAAFDWGEGGLWIRRSISEIDSKRIPDEVLARYGDAIVPLPDTTRVLRIKQTKTRRVRFVPLPADILTGLRGHVTAQRQRLADLLGEKAPHDCWLFSRPDAPGELWAPSAFTSCYRALLLRRGLKPARFHDLRHAYGSHLIGGGEDIRTVSSLLGHSRTSTTVNVYAHLLEKPGQEVAKRIQARIERAKEKQPSTTVN